MCSHNNDDYGINDNLELLESFIWSTYRTPAEKIAASQKIIELFAYEWIHRRMLSRHLENDQTELKIESLHNQLISDAEEIVNMMKVVISMIKYYRLMYGKIK